MSIFIYLLQYNGLWDSDLEHKYQENANSTITQQINIINTSKI